MVISEILGEKTLERKAPGFYVEPCGLGLLVSLSACMQHDVRCGFVGLSVDGDVGVGGEGWLQAAALI